MWAWHMLGFFVIWRNYAKHSEKINKPGLRLDRLPGKKE